MRVRTVLEGQQGRDGIIAHIEEHCSQILGQYLDGDWNKLLYRGMLNIGDYGVVTVRKDRVPSDMPTPLHRVANQYFKENFGVAARSETVMCSTDINMAKEYSGSSGKSVYVLFPYDPFSIIYSSSVEDLFTAYERGEVDDFIKYAESEGYRGEEAEQVALLKMLDANRYRLVRNVNEVLNGNELMVDCDKYVAIDHAKIRDILGSFGK